MASKPEQPLNPRQQRFVAEYLKDHRGGQAYLRAGYRCKSDEVAEACAARLLADARVRKTVDAWREQQIAKVAHETGITLERTLKELAKVAYHDPRKFFDADGNLKPIAELDDDTAAALAGFEVAEDVQGQGEQRRPVGVTKKVKQADRGRYLDMLMRHLGGYKADNAQANPQPAPEASIEDAARRVAFILAAAVHNPADPKKG